MQQLDLYNFIEPSANESEYVLTSPRSLEACTRHNIKPLELLPKTFDEFNDDFGGMLSPSVDPKTMYKRFEKERLRKLRLCREERERIIDEHFHEDFESEEEDSAEEDSVHRERPLMDSFLENNQTLRPKSPVSFCNAMKSSTFELLSGSESDDEPLCQSTRNATPIFMKRPSPRPKSSLSLDEVCDDLPNHLKKNLSSMSLKDRKLLETMIQRAEEDQISQERLLQAELCNNDTQKQNEAKIKAKRDELIARKNKKNEQRMKDVLHRKSEIDRTTQRYREDEMRTKNERWEAEHKNQARKMSKKQAAIAQKNSERSHQQKENLSNLLREEGLWNDVKEFEHDKRKTLKTTTNLAKGISRYELDRGRLEVHSDLQADLEEKQLRAQEAVKSNMLEKRMNGELKRMKDANKREQLLHHRQLIQNDLESWQQEVKEYNDKNDRRARDTVAKKIAARSTAALNNRMIKEIDHATLKARVDEENRLREKELKALISLKDERTKMIIEEKDDFVKASREAARATRAVRDKIKEKTVKSSFDKMAANAELVSRIERLGQRSSTPLAKKSSSGFVLG